MELSSSIRTSHSGSSAMNDGHSEDSPQTPRDQLNVALLNWKSGQPPNRASELCLLSACIDAYEAAFGLAMEPPSEALRKQMGQIAGRASWLYQLSCADLQATSRPHSEAEMTRARMMEVLAEQWNYELERADVADLPPASSDDYSGSPLNRRELDRLSAHPEMQDWQEAKFDRMRQARESIEVHVKSGLHSKQALRQELIDHLQKHTALQWPLDDYLAFLELHDQVMGVGLAEPAHPLMARVAELASDAYLWGTAENEVRKKVLEHMAHQWRRQAPPLVPLAASPKEHSPEPLNADAFTLREIERIHELHDAGYRSAAILAAIDATRVRWEAHVARMGSTVRAAAIPVSNDPLATALSYVDTGFAVSTQNRAEADPDPIGTLRLFARHTEQQFDKTSKAPGSDPKAITQRAEMVIRAYFDLWQGLQPDMTEEDEINILGKLRGIVSVAFPGGELPREIGDMSHVIDSTRKT